MQVKRIVFLANLLAIAIVVNILESLIPSIFIPGVKLGLANIIILILLYNFKTKEAFTVMFLRILIVSFISGTFLNYVFFMSLTGGVLAFITMYLLKKTKLFTEIGVSIGGSLFHSIGQIIVAIIVTETVGVAYYLPYIIILSIPTGIFVGIVSKYLNKLSIFKMFNNNYNK